MLICKISIIYTSIINTLNDTIACIVLCNSDHSLFMISYLSIPISSFTACSQHPSGIFGQLHSPNLSLHNAIALARTVPCDISPVLNKCSDTLHQHGAFLRNPEECKSAMTFSISYSRLTNAQSHLSCIPFKIINCALPLLCRETPTEPALNTTFPLCSILPYIWVCPHKI